MINSNRHFDMDTCDVGIDTSFGLTKGQVDDSIKHGQWITDKRCLICGNTAQYSLIAKKPQYNTKEIQDNGFICGFCLNANNNINKDNYGIRELDK